MEPNKNDGQRVLMVDTGRLAKFIYKHPTAFRMKEWMKRRLHGPYHFMRTIYQWLRLRGVKNPFYNFFVFPIGAFLRKKRFPPAYNPYKPLEAIRNRHAGESCFIIGNGPSLSMADLEKLEESGIPSFAMNLAYVAYEDTKWRATYYLFGEPHFFELPDEIKKEVPFGQLSKRETFMSQPFRKLKLQDVVYVPVSWTDQWVNSRPHDYFSDDLLWGLYTIGSSGVITMQLAAHLGFKKIYLLGMDNTFESPEGKRYFSNKYIAGVTEMPPNPEETLIYQEEGYKSRAKCFEIMGNNLKKSYGVEIFNATRGGALEVFPRIDFDDAMKEIKEEKK